MNFELSKSQKKIIKKVTKFLKSGECETNIFDNEQAEREPLMNFESHGNLYFLNFRTLKSWLKYLLFRT